MLQQSKGWQGFCNIGPRAAAALLSPPHHPAPSHPPTSDCSGSCSSSDSASSPPEVCSASGSGTGAACSGSAHTAWLKRIRTPPWPVQVPAASSPPPCPPRVLIAPRPGRTLLRDPPLFPDREHMAEQVCGAPLMPACSTLPTCASLARLAADVSVAFLVLFLPFRVVRGARLFRFGAMMLLRRGWSPRVQENRDCNVEAAK